MSLTKAEIQAISTTTHNALRKIINTTEHATKEDFYYIHSFLVAEAACYQRTKKEAHNLIDTICAHAKLHINKADPLN